MKRFTKMCAILLTVVQLCLLLPQTVLATDLTKEEEIAALDEEYERMLVINNTTCDTEISLNQDVMYDLMDQAGVYYLRDKAYYQTEAAKMQKERDSLIRRYYNSSGLEQLRIKEEMELLDEEINSMLLCVHACDAQEEVDYWREEKVRRKTLLDNWYEAELQEIEDKWNNPTAPPAENDNPTTPPAENDNPTTPPASENPFVDVAADVYYYAPVLWAVENGITTGMSETIFAPDGTCTRAQIVTFLWRANGSPAPAFTTNPFTDVPAGQWYTDAVLWAVEKGITTGTSATTFSPDAGCTRGQVATFLWRVEDQPSSGAENIFTDITPGAYYYDAVLWAVANEITNGMGDGLFAPDSTCTRGQIVTFLYRAMA